MQWQVFFDSIHQLEEADKAMFSAALRRRSCTRGQILVAPGQIQKELFLIREGIQMAYYLQEEKMHVMAFTYAPGICAIPESFFSQKSSECFLQCLTDSKMDSIGFDELQQLFDTSRGIERLFRKMTETVLAGMIGRHAELHALDIEQRFLAFCKRSPHLLRQVPHKYLASYLGINPTNFSKLYNTVKF